MDWQLSAGHIVRTLMGKVILKMIYSSNSVMCFSFVITEYKISGAWQTEWQMCVRSAITGRVMADVSSNISPIIRTFA